MEPALKTKQPGFLRRTGLLLLFASALVWLGVQGYSAEWTGFGKPLDGPAQAKTLWDWMDLLLIPLILAGSAFLLNRSARETERQRSQGRAALERGIAEDRQQETALQAYYDRMADLLLKDKLSRFSSDEVRNAARVRTLTVLRGLDAKRRGLALLFLKDSGLIEREAVIDLGGACLSGASLNNASLGRVNLSEADLSGADLRGASLAKSYLSCTNLSGAELSGADLSGADLFEASLNNASLIRANLRGASLNGADLRGCRLGEADLSGADLSGVNLNVGDLAGASLRGANLGGVKLMGADLSRADLSGTGITQAELEQARSLEGATLPDGTRHE
jgi:uncharacterized protein YjbI with pentapeptide repeats